MTALDETIARGRALVDEMRAEAEAVGQPRAKGLRWNATDLEKRIEFSIAYAAEGDVTPTR